MSLSEASASDLELAAAIKAATRTIEAQTTELEDKMKRVLDEGERPTEDFPQVAALQATNAKLRHRAAILESAIGREEAAGPRDNPAPVFQGGLQEHLSSLFGTAAAAAFPDLSLPPPQVTETAKIAFGDFQYNSAMQIAQALAKAGRKTAPRQVAEAVLASLPADPLIDRTEIAGPGYINIHLGKGEIGRLMSQLLLGGVKPPTVPRKRVVIDYSAPNIAKEMHVGHLRSTIIGESLSRLLTWVGCDVVRLNHLGDWGTQFGMLIAHLKDKFPDYRTKTPPIAQLQAFYKESKTRFDSDEEFKKRAYDCVVKLQSHDADVIGAWKLICEISRKDFEKIYHRLDVHLTERGESFYQVLMVDLVKDLRQKNILVEEEGRSLMWVGKREVPLTVVKSDGGFTYDTSDLSALRHRLEEEKADWILYVVDNGQSLHLESVFEAGRQMGWYSAEEKRVEHVGFGVVLGEDGKKFKTRSGDTDEGMKKAQSKLVEKERDKELSPEELVKAAEAVAYGCVKYADLSHNRTQDYVFSFDRMLDDKGNTAVYLLYALTRIRSIARTAGVSRTQLRDWLQSPAATAQPLLTEPSELRLARDLLKFPDVVRGLVDRLMLHPLCEYLYSLSSLFSDFYAHCYCVEKDTATGNSRTWYEVWWIV